jgi:hypothetical protein
VIGGGTLATNPGPSWQVIGTGDFYGNGYSDILWQNTDGQAAIWEMNGTSVIGGGLVGANPGPSWQVIGTGDFNGDGKSDILQNSSSGQVAIWEMDGRPRSAAVSSAIPGRAGMLSVPAISTTTASPTSCSRTPVGSCDLGDERHQRDRRRYPSVLSLSLDSLARRFRGCDARG